jgi:DNA-binding CsgD family transcriptional regulator
MADLPELIGLIYDAAMNPESWSTVIDRTADIIHATSAVLVRPLPGGRPETTIGRGLPDDFERIYGEYAGGHVLAEASLRLPVGSVTTEAMLVPVEPFRRSDYYNGFLKPLGVETTLGVTLAPMGAALCAFGRFRKDGEWDIEQIEFMRHLAPHLRRAIEIGRRLDDAELNRTGAEVLNALPHAVMLADHRAHVVFANPAAERLLVEATGIRLVDGTLAGATAHHTARLRQAVMRAARGQRAGDSLTIAGLSGETQIAHVAPVGPELDWLRPARPMAVVVVGEAADTRHATTAAARRLSPRELQCLRLVAAGASSKAIATALGLSAHTVNQYIESAMRKLGAASRTEAVAKILLHV